MAIQTEPTRIQIPFADSGTKNVIPDTNSTPSASQAASWMDGFPAQCSLPLSAGGIPPARADFNGIFNTMSQSIRYGQEGGVWAWDATVDYGTNRIVLGSDGKLYWSIAQSGPNVGGAQNPTTDTGIYWSTMPMATPPLADDSNKTATTEWVKDIVLAVVFVDPAGNDSNDGLTSATAVKTIQRGIDVAGSLPGSEREFVSLEVSGGTYAEDIAVELTSAILVLNGDVTITGTLTFNRKSFVVLQGSYDLTINGNVSISNNSSLIVNTLSYTNNGSISANIFSLFYPMCPLSISVSNSPALMLNRCSLAQIQASLDIVASGGANAFYVHGNSILSTNSTLNISASNCTNYVANFETGSYGYLAGKMSISGSSNIGGIYVGIGANIVFAGGFEEGDSFSGGAGFYVDNGACQIVKASVIYGSSAGSALSMYNNGLVLVPAAITLSVYGKNTSSPIIYVTSNSTLRFSSTGTLSITGTSGTFNSAINVNFAGNVCLANLSVSGAYTDVVYVSNNSFFYIPSARTVTNNATGRRYYVCRCSQINIEGTGANRLPGSTAGTAESSQYSIYV